MATLNLVIAEDYRGINHEREWETLNKLGLVRGTTSLDQWYLLVNEGWRKTKLPLNDIVRDYLAVMLHRHMKNHALFEQLSAFNYLSYLLGRRKVDEPCVQDVADMCLQCAALFPEFSERRHEMKSYRYVITTGASLYRQLAQQATGKDDWYSRAYQTVADSFGQAMMVLRSTYPRFVKKDSGRVHTSAAGIEILTDVRAKEIASTMYNLEQLVFEDTSSYAQKQVQ